MIFFPQTTFLNNSHTLHTSLFVCLFFFTDVFGHPLLYFTILFLFIHFYLCLNEHSQEKNTMTPDLHYNRFQGQFVFLLPEMSYKAL